MKILAKVFSNDELVIMFIGNVEDYMLGEDSFNKELHEFKIEYLGKSNFRFESIDFQYSDLSIYEIEKKKNLLEVIVEEKLHPREGETLYRFSLKPVYKKNL